MARWRARRCAPIDINIYTCTLQHDICMYIYIYIYIYIYLFVLFVCLFVFVLFFVFGLVIISRPENLNVKNDDLGGNS